MLAVLASALIGVAQTPAAVDLTVVPFSRLRDKIVDANGIGPEKRPTVFANMRAILPGLVFRSGVNIAYSPIRSPLSPRALAAACAAGFDTAFFLYNKPVPVPLARCTRDRKQSELRYFRATITGNDSARDEILAAIHSMILSGRRRPILLHDYGGLHVAGYISAIVLQQYCGITRVQAVSYWKSTDDDVPATNGAALIKDIERFTPLEKFRISSDAQRVVCPPEYRPRQ